MKPGLKSHLTFLRLISSWLVLRPLQKVKVCRVLLGLVFVKYRYLSQFGAMKTFQQAPLGVNLAMAESMVTPNADNNSCPLPGQYIILFTHIHD